MFDNSKYINYNLYKLNNLIESDWGNWPYEVRQPALKQGANTSGMMPNDESCLSIIEPSLS